LCPNHVESLDRVSDGVIALDQSYKDYILNVDLDQNNKFVIGAGLLIMKTSFPDNKRPPFQIFGPYEVDKLKAAHKEYQKTFWRERDEDCPKLSDANGLYLFSLHNGPNYEPSYVGITKRDFRKEVFNSRNLVKILDRFANQKGTLYLHLLAKPKDNNIGFLTVRLRTLLFTEMFLLLLCRKKNPDITNIVGHPFLDDGLIEGLTFPSKGKGKNVRTFRKAIGIDGFVGAAGNGRKKLTTPGATKLATKPPAKPPTSPIAQPTTQLID